MLNYMWSLGVEWGKSVFDTKIIYDASRLVQIRLSSVY